MNRSTLANGIEDGFALRDYAREELRAEISSMITGDRLQIGHDSTRHAAYVGSWIPVLKDDPRETYRASNDAQDMSDYLLDRGREHQKGWEQHAEARVLASRRDRGCWPPSAGPAIPEMPRRPAVKLPLPGQSA